MQSIGSSRLFGRSPSERTKKLDEDRFKRVIEICEACLPPDSNYRGILKAGTIQYLSGLIELVEIPQAEATAVRLSFLQRMTIVLKRLWGSVLSPTHWEVRRNYER